VGANVRRAIRAGAVGINIEDSFEEGGPLRGLDDQIARIGAARAAADDEGLPLVINARVDACLGGVKGSTDDVLELAIARARAYLGAGADCVFPILMNDLASLKKLRAAVEAPVNVFLWAASPPMRELEAAGIARVSVGPGWIKAGAAAMQAAARALRDYDAGPLVATAMATDEIRALVCKDKMKPSAGD
jgi:2-methylisocitrate lyase-like PEP mutase family enzyme